VDEESEIPWYQVNPTALGEKPMKGENLTWAPTLETERERAKLLLKAYLSLSIKEIFPSLLLLKEIDCPGDFAKAYRRLAGYLGKSGLEEMKLFSKICEETAKGVENLTPSGRGLFNKRGGRDLGQPYDPAKFIQRGKKINVLMETRSLDRGGLEEVIYNIARHLDRDLFNLVIVCTDRGGSVAERCRKIGIPVEILKDEKEREYREILLRYDVDLLVTHYSTFGVDFATEMSIPIVSFLHNIYCWVPDDVLGEMKRADQKIDRYIAVSQDVKNYSVYRFNISPERIVTVPNGIDLDRLKEKENLSVLRREDIGLENGDYIFLNVASLTPAKAHPLILAALKEVIAEHPEVKVLCIGETLDQEYGEFVKAQIAVYGLERHIRLVEFAEEMHSYYKMSDAFLLPSIIEGWSLSMMEAMAYGLPLILTKVGGASEVVVGNDVGLLADNRYPDIFGIDRSALDNYRNELPPNIRSLKKAMLQFLKEKAYWKEAGLRGKRKVADQFDIRNIVDRYEAVFHSVVALNAKAVRNKLSDQRDALLRERDFLLAEQECLSTERDRALGEKDRLLAEQERLSTERDRALGEKDRLLAEQERLSTERDHLSAERSQFLNVQEGLLAVKNKLSDQRDALLRERDFLLPEQDRLSAERDRLLVEQDRLLVEQDRLSAERKQFLNVQEGLLKEMSQRLQKREEEIDEIRHLIDSRYQQLDKRIEYVVMRLSIKERVKERLHKLLKAVHTLVPKKFRGKYRSQYRRFFFDRIFPDKERLEQPFPTPGHPNVLAGEELERFLNSAQESNAENLFVIYTTDPFVESRGQRSTWLAKEFSRRGIPVVFFYWRWNPKEEIVKSPDPQILSVPIDQFSKIEKYLFSFPSDRLKKIFLVEFPDSFLFEKINMANAHSFLTVYDCVDDWGEFARAGQAVWYDDAAERYLVRNVDLVLATNSVLAEKLKQIGAEKVQIVPNGVDVESLREKQGIMKSVERGTLTIGYFGHLTESWFDWDLVLKTASKKRDWFFHIIGYGEPSGLKFPENIKFWGKIEHQNLPSYARSWDVAIIPFKQGKLTQAVDPIKLYEYLFLGLPVVATNMPHLQGIPGVFPCNRDQFEQTLVLAKETPFNRSEVERFIENNTWEKRVDRLLEEIDKVDLSRDPLKGIG
jgi:glycosyltransferase involved in cell wall biosynthesis